MAHKAYYHILYTLPDHQGRPWEVAGPYPTKRETRKHLLDIAESHASFITSRTDDKLVLENDHTFTIERTYTR